MKKINNHTLFLIIAFLGFTVLSWGQTDLARWDLTSNGTVSYSDSSVNVTGVHSGGIAVSYDSQGMNTTQWNNPDVVHYRYFGISVASSNGSPVDIASLMFEQETFGPQNYTIRYYISPDGSLPADDGWGFLNTLGSTILINNESIASNPVKSIPLNMTISGTQRLIIRFYGTGNDWGAGWRIKANTLKITAPANSPTDLARWNNTNFTPTEVSNNINASNITIAGSASMTVTGTGADSRFETTNWSNSINTSNYVEFTISPNAGYKLNLEKFNFDIRRSNPGSGGFEVRYSKDNFTTYTTAITNTDINTTWTSYSANISSAGTIMPGQTFRIRIYGRTDNNNPNRQIWIRRLLNTNIPNDFSHTPNITGVVTPIPTDLEIEKTVNNDQPEVDDNVTFTITVTNNGPNNATGVTVTDQLPNGYTYVSHNTATGSYNQGTGIWTIGNLANGNSATLTITATVLGSGTYNNTALVTSNEPDPTPANNSDTVIVMPNIPTADLKITKTVDEDEPSISENITFTLTVTNDGPDNATGVVVTDQLPNGYTYVNHSTVTGSYNQGTGIWTIGNLTNGNSATLTITATVLGSGNHTNTAIVTANEYDPTADNNTDSVTPTVDTGEVDLEISKIASHYGNDNNRYSYFGISVRNNGPGAATDIEVEDILDVVWDFSAQAYVASHGTVTATGTLNREITWNIPYLPSGGVAVLLFRTGQTASFTNPWENPPTKTNTATITSLDQDDTNDANDSVTITSTPYWNNHLYELGVTKTVSPEEPFIGDVVEFTIIVEKSGNTEGGPDSLQLIDKLPPGFTYISSNATRGTYNSTTGIWTVGSGWGWSGTETLTITAIVNAPTGQPDEYKNVVSIFSAGQFSDTEINNNMASVTIPTPIPVPASTDLSVSIQVNNETPEACIDDVIFTITASNLGDNNASGVKVTNLLPSGYTYVSSTASKGSYVSGTGIWTVGNLAIGANATLTITAKALATGDYVNTVLISYDHSDSNIANNTDEISVTPNLSNAVDLSISKTVDNDKPDIATNVVFTIEIENLGSTEATGVVVTDIIPTGFTFVSSSQGTYDSNTRTVTWNVGNLAASANTSFTITAKVKASGNHNNTTMVTSNECDLNTANNSSSVSVVPNVDNAIDLKVTQTVSNEFPAIGATVVFTITAQNLGPNSATGVVVNNLLANGFQLVGTPIASEGSYSSGVWTIGNMADSASATLQVSAIVLGGEGASYLSIAEITGNEPDFDDNIINNRAYEILSPEGQEFLHCDINAENPVFSENFGSGASVFGGELPEGRTNLAYYQPNNPPGSYPGDYVADGSYVIGQDAYQAFNVWKNIPDHTGLSNGYYMIMNADLEPHEFFRIRIDLAGEFCSNTRYVASFWMANINSQADFDYCAGQGGLILPEIGYFIQNHTGEVLGAGASGEIQYTPTAQWVQYEFIFTTSDEDEYFDLVLFNKAPGGCGNDLAIDDITVYACMTPPIRLDMTIESNQLEVCGGEQVIMSVIYTPNLDDENDDYEWPPASWNDVEYQWQRSLDQITWVDIPGEITDTYIIESFKEEDQAYYRLLYAQVGNIDKASCRFPSDDLFPLFNATPVLGEITPEVDEDELCVGKGPFQLTSEYDTSNYLVWNEEDEVWENVWGADFYEWTSSNDNIATIDPVTGMLTPVAPGYVTITYAVQSPKGECLGSITKVFTIRNADCDAPPSPTKLITNPHILKRTK